MARPRKTALRAVSAAERAEKPPYRVKTLKAATELSERDLLATMRAKIATEIDSGVPPHALGQLIRQLRDVDKEIRQLDHRAGQEAGDDGGDVDDSFDQASI